MVLFLTCLRTIPRNAWSIPNNNPMVFEDFLICVQYALQNWKVNPWDRWGFWTENDTTEKDTITTHTSFLGIKRIISWLRVNIQVFLFFLYLNHWYRVMITHYLGDSRKFSCYKIIVVERSNETHVDNWKTVIRFANDNEVTIFCLSFARDVIVQTKFYLIVRTQWLSYCLCVFLM